MNESEIYLCAFVSMYPDQAHKDKSGVCVCVCVCVGGGGVMVWLLHLSKSHFNWLRDSEKSVTLNYSLIDSPLSVSVLSSQEEPPPPHSILLLAPEIGHI